MEFFQSSIQLRSFYFLWWIIRNHDCKHVLFWELSIVYQLDKEFYKLIVLIRTILVTNNRKQSTSSWSKMLRCVTDLKGRGGARIPVSSRPLSSSFACSCLYFFLPHFFPHHFSLACSALMERKHGCWLDLPEFFIYDFSHLESDRLALFLVTKSLAKASEWFSMDQMLTLEWICWPEQALGGDAPDILLDQLTGQGTFCTRWLVQRLPC